MEKRSPQNCGRMIVYRLKNFFHRSNCKKTAASLHLSCFSRSANLSFRSLRRESRFPCLIMLGIPSMGHTQMGPTILCLHCYCQVLDPPSRSTVTMPSHSWYCYQYCYYYRYCYRLRPSDEWKSRSPVSQLLRRVSH